MFVPIFQQPGMIWFDPYIYPTTENCMFDWIKGLIIESSTSLNKGMSLDSENIDCLKL